MSNYVKITDYAAKDALLTGNPSKVVSGTEIGADFDAVATAVATKVDSGGALGTPSSGTLTNCTGTAAGLTAGTVTTNANLTGHVTSVGNAAVLGSFTIAQLNTAVSDANVAQAGANSDITSLTGITGLINEAQGSNIASASTINLTTATGNYVHITGTTTITAITLAQGAERTIVFDGALTFTNGASLILPSGANITTAAGDTAIVRGEAAGVVRCINYTRANGLAVIGETYASSAENIAGTIENKAVDPLGIREAFNATGSAPVYACRAWVNFNGTGTVAIRASGNVSSITDGGTGLYTVNFTTAMVDANYSAVAATGQAGAAAATQQQPSVYTYTTSAVSVSSTQGSTRSFSDASEVSVAIFR
jgi:hypothetical protein